MVVNWKNVCHYLIVDCKTRGPVRPLPDSLHLRFVNLAITSSGRWQSELNYGLPATNVWSHNRSRNLKSISRRMRYRTRPVVPPHYVELTMDLKSLCPTIVWPVKNVHRMTGVDKKIPNVLYASLVKLWRECDASNFLGDQSRKPVSVVLTCRIRTDFLPRHHKGPRFEITF